MALDFFAGCVGGCAGILVGHPLDTIKVHLQTQDFRNPIYRGTFHCFQTILQKESVRGLYRGISSPLSGVAVINAIVFGVYGNTQRRMQDPDSLSSHFLAGFTAGLAQSVVCSPMELAKIRMQVQQRGAVYRSSLHCLMQVARTDGISGVYRGFGITMLRDAPAMGVYFLSYELMTRSSSAEPLSTAHVMVAGGLAGTISWIATFPFDVLKSRVQLDGMYGPAQYSGVVDCFRQSLRSEGPSFIVRGLTSTIIRSFPVNAATFAGVTWVFRLAGVGSRTEEQSEYFVASQYEDQETTVIKMYNPLPPQELWGFSVERLRSKWENKSLQGLFQWRKLMIHNIEGSFFQHQDINNVLSKKFVSGDVSGPELLSRDSASSHLRVESSTDPGDDGITVPLPQLSPVNIEAASPEEGDLSVSDGEVAIDKTTFKDKYRTRMHENG